MAKTAQKQGKVKPSTKPKSGEVTDVTSRITFGSKASATEPLAPKITKEDATQQFAEASLKASESATANVRKTQKGRCLMVEFGNLATQGLSVTAFVFGGDHIVIGGELSGRHDTDLYNQFKRTYSSIEDASKFMRLLIKGKVESALKVPIKPPRSSGGETSDDTSV